MTISETPFVVIDTETTGLDYASGDRVVEIGAVGRGRSGQTFETLVNPQRPIPILASAIHHLTDNHVRHAPTYFVALLDLKQRFLEWFDDDPVIVAHNAAFDRSFLPGLESYRWLCTKRLAQHLVPDAPAFNNQVLRYYFGGGDLDMRDLVPHRALADSLVTEFNLGNLLHIYHEQSRPNDVDALIALADSPILMSTMPFGKHKGLAIGELPADYIRWALREIKDDPDLRYTLQTELGRRGAVPA